MKTMNLSAEKIRSVPISHEMYMKIRNKQNELIDISRGSIQMRDVVNIVVKSTIDSVHLEQDREGWILSTDPEPINTEEMEEEKGFELNKESESIESPTLVNYELNSETKNIQISEEQPIIKRKAPTMIKRIIRMRTGKKDEKNEPDGEKVRL